MLLLTTLRKTDDIGTAIKDMFFISNFKFDIINYFVINII